MTAEPAAVRSMGQRQRHMAGPLHVCGAHGPGPMRNLMTARAAASDTHMQTRKHAPSTRLSSSLPQPNSASAPANASCASVMLARASLYLRAQARAPHTRTRALSTTMPARHQHPSCTAVTHLRAAVSRPARHTTRAGSNSRSSTEEVSEARGASWLQAQIAGRRCPAHAAAQRHTRTCAALLQPLG
jgi:hypothetical protein